jgi:hypothetical protein
MNAREHTHVDIEGLAEAKLVLLLSTTTSPPEWVQECLKLYLQTFQKTDQALLILHDPLELLATETLADDIAHWTALTGSESSDIILLEQTEAPFSACDIYLCLDSTIACLPTLYQAIRHHCWVAIPETAVYAVLPTGARLLKLQGELPSGLQLLFSDLKSKPLHTLRKTIPPDDPTRLLTEARRIADNIQNNIHVSHQEMLPLLSAPIAAIRQQINHLLGKALLAQARYQEAFPFLERAWLISNHDPHLLSDYLTVLSQLKYFDKITACYRLLGHRAADRQEIDTALYYFQLCCSVYNLFAHSDRFLWHEDIAEKVILMASPWVQKPTQGHPLSENRKIRLGHVVHDITEPISVMMKHSLTLIRHHNRALFEMYCFIHQPESVVMSNPHACEMVKILKDCECQLIFGPETHSTQLQMCTLAEKIMQCQIDVLLLNLQMAMISMSFLTALRPAPVMIGLNHGHPYMFSSRLLDWNIAWSCYPLIDSIGNCTMVYGALDLERIKNTELFQLNPRPQSGPSPLILMSSGRPLKYHCADYWQAICDILAQYPHCEYWVIGITAEQLDFWAELPAHVKRQIHFLGWQSHFDSFRWLGVADIYLDTFPTGGGFAMYEAMAVGLPALSFQNDYTRLFDPSDWSPAYEYFQIPELIAPRWDYEGFKTILSMLIENPEQRQRLGQLAREKVWQHVGNPAEMTRQTESVILDVLAHREPGSAPVSP